MARYKLYRAIRAALTPPRLAPATVAAILCRTLAQLRAHMPSMCGYSVPGDLPLPVLTDCPPLVKGYRETAPALTSATQWSPSGGLMRT